MKRLFIIVMLLLYIGCMASCGKEETNSDSGSMTTTVSEISTETSVSVDTVKTDNEKADKPEKTEETKTTAAETEPDVSETADVEVTETDDYSIDGTWKIIRIDVSDGSCLEGDDLDSYEAYEISGDKGTYTAELGDNVKNWNITLEKTEEQRYIIKIEGKLKLCEAEFDGDTMFYTIDTGDVKDTFTFERQK